MLSFISLLLVLTGSLNWFCIGILQYDFVAGLFGSQSSIFSRLVYTIVGVAAIIMTVNLIKNKGKLVTSFKKMQKDIDQIKEENREKKFARQSSNEISNDNSIADKVKEKQDTNSEFSNDSQIVDSTKSDNTDKKMETSNDFSVEDEKSNSSSKDMRNNKKD